MTNKKTLALLATAATLAVTIVGPSAALADTTSTTVAMPSTAVTCDMRTANAELKYAQTQVDAAAKLQDTRTDTDARISQRNTDA
ncbi:MAG: hypothetical protein WA001_01235, partial [Patescibacteria group bacterium]